MTAWLSAMVSERKIGYRLKLDTARNWWVFGLIFYGLMGMAAIYAALTDSNTAARGLGAIESALITLLLFETLMHRITRHIMSELPMAGDVVADCLRLVARLYVIILIADALMVRVLGAMTPEEWLPHDRGAKLAAVSAVVIYAFWRFVKFRMDFVYRLQPAALGRCGGRRRGRREGRGLAPAHPDAAAARHRRLASSSWSAACWCCRSSASTSRR